MPRELARRAVLEVPSASADPAPDRDYHLDGRGLLLEPSVFFGPHPIYFRDPRGNRRNMLVYPAAPDRPAAEELWTAPVDRTLAGLLGATRAKVLTAAIEGGTTTARAQRTGVSLASASEHARALRDAGLLRTHRRGTAVHHNVTALGVRLLDRRD